MAAETLGTHGRTAETTSLWLSRAPDIPSDQFEPDTRYDEVVVGGGITGLVTALLFARAGRKVAVLEAREAGALTTGNTTAKLSVLQGTQFSAIRAHSYQAVLDAYVEANSEGFAWMSRYAGEHGIPLQVRDAFSYAGTRQGVERVDHEYQAAKSAGLDVMKTGDIGMPFPTFGAVVLKDQAQFDPMDVVRTLVDDIRAHGGVVVERTRVTSVRASIAPTIVHTQAGSVRAEHVIVATGMPILDRGLYWAKLRPSRSYAASYRVPGELPQGMYVSVDEPKRSVRTTPGEQGEYLIVGGNGHGVGRHPSPKMQVADLNLWATQYWPGAERTHVWSAQDYETPQRVPFVGWMPRGFGRVYLATGYDKWGMTNSVQCALTLAADILGGNLPWAKTLHRRVSMPAAAASFIGANAAVAWWYARGYAAALSRKLPDGPPEEGQAAVGREGLHPTGISTVDGVTCRVSAVCPHLRGVLNWNDHELSWDCPAHGSRFAADGSRLEGPAKRDLKLR